MRMMDDLSLNVAALKAVVLGLVSTIQHDRETLKNAQQVALNSLGAPTREDLNLMESYVAAILSPKIHSEPTDTQA
ncbi:hypothetical protein [Pseudomonas putida]|uniref:Uncharacterized protein n=1 Tax=Pseudomonas putida TaxID=303 RepID=A0A9X8EL62_PSEPU|nr:hypothetical protein [Pseudomonas putida]ROQ53667.1 hypothetical protein EDF85_1431 [Pseudomonas putida]